MPHITFHIHGNLDHFLRSSYSTTTITTTIPENSSIKDAIESLGIPHPEVDLILANHTSVRFDYQPQPHDIIEVHPIETAQTIPQPSRVRPTPLTDHRFILDVHLGKLANYLRLLGFDTLYRNDYDDPELAQISHDTNRILLTQDIGLLKRSIVTYGYCVRSQNPRQQVKEILTRYHLAHKIHLFKHCAQCNGLVQPVAKNLVEHHLESGTRNNYDEFFQCASCQQVYWKGAHYQRIQQLVTKFTN